MACAFVDAFNTTGVTRDMVYPYCGLYAMIAFFNWAVFFSNPAWGTLGRHQIAPRITWIKSTIVLFPYLAAGSCFFGLYGVAFGVLLNATIFAPIAHFPTMRSFEQSRLMDPVDIDEEGQAVQTAPTVEHNEPQHT